MASPTQNGVGVTFFSPASTGIGRYVAQGVKWGGGLGSGVTLPYSFPDYNSLFVQNYGNSETTSFAPLTQNERNAAYAALGVWDSVSNFNFYESYDNAEYVGEIRFGKTTIATGNEAAHAYFPSSNTTAGDVWFLIGSWHKTDTPIRGGSYDFVATLHELGHALGLKHSFQGADVLPAPQDNYFFTIMSYTASPWSAPKDNFASFYPTTPMYYDLVAIQAMYGRDITHNAGNTTYSFSSSGTYFQTIDDAGGSADKIVYSGSVACEIDLRPGAYSSVGRAIKFTSESSSYTVCIGPGTILERAYGGSGGDKLIGNTAANYLSGNAGNDRINGGSGSDHLSGGGGNDFLTGGTGRDILSGGPGADRFDFNAVAESKRDSQRDQVSDFHHSQHDRIDLSSIDADTSSNPGNDVFKFIGTQGFHGGGGEVRFSGGIVRADIDGDRVSDLEIKIDGVSSLSKADFYL